jgi:Flp pilus assembly protein TadD
MSVRVLCTAALVLVLAPPVYADKRSDAKVHVDFGITLAQRGLWRDATGRFERAVEIDATYAAAWNDLAIGYEQLGEFDKARSAYEKALQIEPNNTMISNNYAQFRDIYDRQNRRRGK